MDEGREVARGREPEAVAVRPRTSVVRNKRRGPGLAVSAVKSRPVPLDAGMATAAAFQAVARACLCHLLVNEATFVAGGHPEALHQCRVAIRRLRSALSVFGEIVADDEIGTLQGRLRALSAPLGRARDLDVYRGRVLMTIDGVSEGTAPDLAALDEERRRAYERVLREFRSPGFRRLVAEFVAWAEVGPWLTAQGARRASRRDRPVEAFAAEVLKARRRALERKGRHLAGLDPEARHRVRILAKKLRYASEFFAPLAVGSKGRARHKAFVGALERLQESLGTLNDAATARRLAAELRPLEGASGERGATVDPPGPEDEEALLDAAARDYRSVVEAKPFWG